MPRLRHRIVVRLLWLVLAVARLDAAAPWQQGEGFRSRPLDPRGTEKPYLKLVSGELSGIAFTNSVSQTLGLTNQILYSGSGLAAGDVDGDERPDLYLCSLEGKNALYRNLGDWKFEEITERAGVRCADQATTGAVLVDLDGDGDLDLLVSSLARGVRLFRNDGAARFTEATEAAGLRSQHASLTMTLADIEGDGDLDLYVANYRASTFRDTATIRFDIKEVGGQRQIVAVDGRPTSMPDLVNRFAIDSRGLVVELSEAHQLYVNDGTGRFHEVSWTGGVFVDEDGQPLSSAPLDWGLSAMFRDLNQDGSPDLYVCNDNESPDRIWLNDGLGRFRALPQEALRETSLSSMGVDFADLNRDGYDDFFVTDMLAMTHALLHTQMPTRWPMAQLNDPKVRPAFPRNTLFLNRGDSTYAEVAYWAGLERSDWSWTPVFLDVDLDGYEDLLITTGVEKNLLDADSRTLIAQLQRSQRLDQQEFIRIRSELPPLTVPNHVFRNRGDLRFEDASDAWGFNATQSSHGMALADFDADGDLDVAVSCLNAPPLLYENTASNARLSVRLHGRGKNQPGIGARIELTGGPVPQSQEMICGGRFLSSDDFIRVFACDAARKMQLRVIWRSGRETRLADLEPNRLYEIDEPAEVALGPHRPPDKPAATWFADVSSLLDHRHEDVEFSDFERQPMLPRRLSLASPGLSWCDWNKDGYPDLIITPGRGGEFVTMAGDGRGFRRMRIPGFGGRATDDIGSALLWPVDEQTNLLFFSQSSYESTNATAAFGFEIGPERIQRVAELPDWGAAVFALAAADVDGDNDLDLVAAGAFAPGKYPVKVSSRFYRNDAGQFKFEDRGLNQVGLVNAVLFSDLDADGKPELILSCELDSLRIFRYEAAGFVETTESWGLARYTGWWYGVASGDFDGDGRLDLVAGNWGGNHRYQRFMAEPIQILHADLEGDGREELIETYYDPVMRKRVPAAHFDALASRLPFIQESVHSFREFAQRGIDELLDPQKSLFQNRSINTALSTVFLNRGDHFEARPLPDQAQLAPVFGVVVADLNGDGHQDLFLSQNFSGPSRDTSWSMAGQGLILAGDGAGGFRPVSAQESGIRVPGDGRGAAVADFDADGRLDLAVGQHAGATKLYQNRAGRPGLEVRLWGSPGNHAAVGAVVWPRFRDETQGPAQEVRAGSGWLSQDYLSVMLCRADQISKVCIRWPGGALTQTPVPTGSRRLVIDREGRVRPTAAP